MESGFKYNTLLGCRVCGFCFLLFEGVFDMTEHGRYTYSVRYIAVV